MNGEDDIRAALGDATEFPPSGPEPASQVNGDPASPTPPTLNAAWPYDAASAAPAAPLLPLAEPPDGAAIDPWASMVAAGHAPAQGIGGFRPTIQIGGGRLPENVDEAERWLIAYDKDIYQRGDFLVRPADDIITIADEKRTTAKRLVQIRRQHLCERMMRVIDFLKYNAKTEDWFMADCPANIPATLLEKVGSWKFPYIAGMTDIPTIGSDGSIFNEKGYNPKTCILYDPGEINYEDFPIPAEPTKQQARKALEYLISLLREFPFTDEKGEPVIEDGNLLAGRRSPSRSVALSAILTAIIRRSIPHAPLHVFTAPAMGSGKSLLADIASMIATGREAPVIAQGKTEEEMEKRLGAALLAGDLIISFDNCEQPLGGELLCQALTQSMLKIRILGRSENVSVPCNAAFYATGNNLVVIGDMIRRTVTCLLDPRTERPETREFKDEDPIKRIRANRPLYVAAALTVLRGYHVAGRPKQSGKPLNGFEAWSRRVRDALLWLGEPDPVATQERTRAEDPQLRALLDVVSQWYAIEGDGGISVRRIIELATEVVPGNVADPTTFKRPDFREALLVVAGVNDTINSLRLGKWLGRMKGRVADGLRIEPDATVEHGGAARWKVIRV
jgi:putative DNA primase/helicase